MEIIRNYYRKNHIEINNIKNKYINPSVPKQNKIH